MKVISTLFLFLLHSTFGISQEAVFLTNPSFEGNPQYASVPGGWRNCAFNDESPPDIHPVPHSTLIMDVNPHHGQTFLGLLAKGNGTTESIGQQLEKPLKKGYCYAISLSLCKSPDYAIFDSYNETYNTYEGTLVLRLWGGSSPCGKKSLLAVSPPIENAAWTKYTFQFSPFEAIQYVIFEAFYIDNTTTAYRGNLMMDNATPFIPIDCTMKMPLINEASLTIPTYLFTKYKTPTTLKEASFWSIEGNARYQIDMRLVVEEEDLEWLIFDNCNRIGFRFSNKRQIDEMGIGLKEIAVNIKQLKTKKLIVGIQHLGARLDKRRTKSIKRTFREIGLPPRFYQIETILNNSPKEGWMCGQKEIWLKLVDG